MNPTIYRSSRSFFLVFFASILALSGARAQDDLSGGLDDVIELPEFVVRDTGEGGYLKTNTISATRLNANVKDLPMPVEVITSDFIQDTGAESLDDALAFSAGLETNLTATQAGDNTSDNTAFRLRGFVQEAALRNGFRKVGDVDTFNITQVDVVRGPNALLYGVGNFGGVVNFITRRPSTSPRYGVGFAIATDNSYRLTVDATGPITDNLRYSLAVVGQTSEAWFDHFENEKIGVAPVIEWQPFKNSTLTIDAEYLQQDQVNPESSFGILSNAYRVPEGGTELERVPYIDLGVFPVVDPQTGEALGIADQRGFLRFPGGGDDFRWINGNESTSKDYGVSLNWRQEIGDALSLQVGYYYSARERESRSANLSLTSVDGFLSTLSDEQLAVLEQDGNGWLTGAGDDPRKDPFGRILTYNWTDRAEKQVRNQFRLEGAYNLPVNDWWENTFIFGGTYNLFQLFESGAGPLRRFDKATLPEGDPLRWEPGDNVNTRYLDSFDYVQSIYDPSPIDFKPRPGEFFARPFGPDEGDKFREIGAYFIHQGTFFENRVRTVTGLRYDKSGVRRADEDFEANSVSFRDWDEPPSATNFSFGVSMQTNKKSPWALYFLTAGAIKPEFGRSDASGAVLAPTSGQSKEIGLKYDFLDSKISGTIAAYEVIREGVIINNNEIAVPVLGDPVFDENTNYGRNALRDDLSRGVDMQTIFTDLPIKNLQTVVNFSYNDYQVDAFSGLTYEDPNPDDRPGVTGKEFFRKDLSSTLPQGRRQNDTPEFSFKVWTKYEFKDGPLKGFNFGGGFRWVDEREVYRGGRADDGEALASFILEDPVTTWDLAFGYKNEFRGIRYNIRLNISNLTNEEGDTFGYSFQSPRSARLSVSANF